MRSSYQTAVAWSAGVLWAATSAWAQSGPSGSPSLLPLPALAMPAPIGVPASYTAEPSTYPRNSSLAKYEPLPDPASEQVQSSPSDAPVQNGNLYDQAANSCWSNDCASSLPSCFGPTCGCSTWFGSFAGLVMTRNSANAFWTTYETNNNPNQLMNTRDANSDWRGGGEVRIGRWFGGGAGCGAGGGCGCGCNRYGIDFTYFQLDNLQGFSSVRGDSVPAGTVSTTIDTTTPYTPSGNVEIGGVGVNTYFDGATEQRITRSDAILNLELNLLQQSLAVSNRAQITWMAGIRYFRFNESLLYASVAGGSEFGDNTGPNVNGAQEAYLNVQSINNLLGAQVGLRADYMLTQRFGLFATPKIGLYGDQINTRAHLYRGDGVDGFDIHGNRDAFSIMAQLDLGLNYRFANNWRAFMGYRVIAITGIALSDHQIPHYLAASDEFADPDPNGSLILHGGFAGIECLF